MKGLGAFIFFFIWVAIGSFFSWLSDFLIDYNPAEISYNNNILQTVLCLYKYLLPFTLLSTQKDPLGITGTTIKDTWTKPRGRVEVGEAGGFSWGGMEGWGEKAYNCN